MTNPFVYMELHPADQAMAKTFYGKLLGWQFADMDMGGANYTMINDGGEPFAGVAPPNGGPNRWVPYLGVGDLDAAVQQAEKLGAKVVQPRVDIPAGSFVWIEDPSGATVALFQNA